jgi:hypothetical protein
VRKLVQAIVWEGMQLYEAAQAAQMHIAAARKALGRPHVLQYLRSEREVLRASLSGSNILTLDEIKRTSRNDNARVNAVKALEQLGDEQQGRNSSTFRAPGMAIVVIQQASVTPHLPHDDAKVLTIQDNPGHEQE